MTNYESKHALVFLCFTMSSAGLSKYITGENRENSHIKKVWSIKGERRYLLVE